MQTETIYIPARFNGPPGMGNGGITAALVARGLPQPSEVRLLAPVPLDVPLTLDADNRTARLFSPGTELAIAQTRSPGPDTPPGPLSLDEAAELPPVDPALHPFPTCFVCGYEREDGMGLEIKYDATTGIAAFFDTNRVDGDGAVPTEYLWGALDCPSGWAALWDIGPGVLGTITAAVRHNPPVGTPLVVTTERQAVEGRKVASASAIYDPAGDLIASATTIWVRIGAQEGAA